MILLNKELFKELEHIKQKLSSHDEELLLIFEYLKQFEEVKQQQIEHTNRKKIGY